MIKLPTVTSVVASTVVKVPAAALAAPMVVPSIEPPLISAVVTLPRSAMVRPANVGLTEKVIDCPESDESKTK